MYIHAIKSVSPNVDLIFVQCLLMDMYLIEVFTSGLLSVKISRDKPTADKINFTDPRYPDLPTEDNQGLIHGKML